MLILFMVTASYRDMSEENNEGLSSTSEMILHSCNIFCDLMFQSTLQQMKYFIYLSDGHPLLSFSNWVNQETIEMI